MTIDCKCIVALGVTVAAFAAAACRAKTIWDRAQVIISVIICAAVAAAAI